MPGQAGQESEQEPSSVAHPLTQPFSWSRGCPHPTSQQCQASSRVETAQAELAVLAAPGWVGAAHTVSHAPLVSSPRTLRPPETRAFILFHANTSHLVNSQPPNLVFSSHEP